MLAGVMVSYLYLILACGFSSGLAIAYRSVNKSTKPRHERNAATLAVVH